METVSACRQGHLRLLNGPSLRLLPSQRVLSQLLLPAAFIALRLLPEFFAGLPRRCVQRQDRVSTPRVPWVGDPQMLPAQVRIVPFRLVVVQVAAGLVAVEQIRDVQ